MPHFKDNIPEILQFESRKRDHIRLALDPENQAQGLSGLDTIHLDHDALPDLNFNEIDISIELFKNQLKTPFLVSSMTAGHEQATHINMVLAQAVTTQGWVMGVGSQRRQLFDEQARQEWQTIRKEVPNAKLLGNIGINQLIQTPISDILKLSESLNAIGMIVHLNPLQECIQPEGTPNFRGGLQAIENLCKNSPIPIIIKETGCGFSIKTLEKLVDIGVAAVDLSGFGGTHWGRIEGKRASENSIQMQTAETFKHWGNSTLDSMLAALELNPDYQIWASGGIRSGLDAAKLIAMGAQIIGFAKPMLEAALQSYDTVIQTMQAYENELKTAMFCTGSINLTQLCEQNLWTIKQ